MECREVKELGGAEKVRNEELSFSKVMRVILERRMVFEVGWVLWSGESGGGC